MDKVAIKKLVEANQERMEAEKDNLRHLSETMNPKVEPPKSTATSTTAIPPSPKTSTKKQEIEQMRARLHQMMEEEKTESLKAYPDNLPPDPSLPHKHPMDTRTIFISAIAGGLLGCALTLIIFAIVTSLN